MKKEELNLENLRKFLLSPGDIFWKKNTGDRVLISKKADICNLGLIEKLINARMEIEIDNSIDSNFVNEADAILKRFEEEILFTKKIEFRNMFFKFINENIVYIDRTQLDLNLIMWRSFSQIDFLDAQKLIERDRSFFERSWTMATTVTIFAMLFGQYESQSLRNLFSQTILDQFKLLGKRTGLAFREKLHEYHIDRMTIEEMKMFFEIDNDLIFFTESAKEGNITNQYSNIERMLIILNENLSLDLQENVIKKILINELVIEKRYMNQFSKFFRVKEVLASNAG